MSAYCFPDSYVVLDTETTGLSADCRVIELAAVLVENRHCTRKYSQLFDPHCRIPVEITRLTGIRQDMVAGQPEIAACLPAFMAECGSLPVIGHNIPFDMMMLRSECARAGLRCTLLQGGDTCTLARRLIPGMASYRLSFLSENLALPMKPCHRAMADVYATALLFERLRSVSESRYSAAGR